MTQRPIETMLPAGLRDVDELVQQHRPAGGMVPPDQRFQANVARGQVHLGPVIELELVALERKLQIGPRRHPLPDLMVELRHVEAILIAPLFLGAIEREVGLRHHDLRRPGYPPDRGRRRYWRWCE
jgi:hypothetical protein